MGPETAVGQHAMNANLFTKLSEGVHHCQQCQVGPGDGPFPEQVHSENRCQERNDNADEHDSFEGNWIVKRKGAHDISLLQNLRTQYHYKGSEIIPVSLSWHAFCVQPMRSCR